MRPTWVLATMAIAALLVGCAAPDVQVRIGWVEPPTGLGSREARLVVRPPRDLRPALEREGETTKQEFFLFLFLWAQGSSAGNEVARVRVDDDNVHAPSHPDLPRELGKAVGDALVEGRAATLVSDAQHPDRILELDLEHAFATQYVREQFAAMMVAGGTTTLASPLSVTVVLRFRLFEVRDRQRTLVRDERVTTNGMDIGAALRQATSLVARQVAFALGPPTPKGLGDVFVIERVNRARDAVERVFVDAASAAVVRRTVEPILDPGYARPGDWLLSRRDPDGAWIADETYARLVTALSRRYDLRTVDDARRKHFFGLRSRP